MDHNTWYYTLSTVIQTLGSVLGIGGMFLVFKLQTVEQEVKEYRSKVVRILKELEDGRETEYDTMGIVDLAARFQERIQSLIDVGDDEFTRKEYGNLRLFWGIATEDLVLSSEETTVFIKRTQTFFQQKAKNLHELVMYRLNLYKWTLITGILLSATIIWGLLMLSGLTHYLNYSNFSENTAIYAITTTACVDIVCVLVTASYAIWGDKN